MGTDTLALFIPILALMLGGFAVFVKSDLGRALARRIGGDPRVASALEDEVRQLQAEVESLRGEMAETHERLDFTERLLTHTKDAERPAEGPAAGNLR
jgi:hypothetical protein